jgi:hypothetical protein
MAMRLLQLFLHSGKRFSDMESECSWVYCGIRHQKITVQFQGDTGLLLEVTDEAALGGIVQNTG